jgi:hypothetical protein
LPSIHDLEPLEKGGEVAREGFIYKDHVGAGFCLDMVELDELLQVWFETHDDITLIWENANNNKGRICPSEARRSEFKVVSRRLDRKGETNFRKRKGH